MITALLIVTISLAAPPTAAQIREAELLAAKGVASFQAKSYANAAEYFLEAYELSGEPTQLRNAAKAREAGGENELAQVYWKKLLALPDLSEADREEAKSHVIVEPPEPPKQPVIEEPPPAIAAPITREPDSDTRPWILAGAGAAAIATGAVLFVISAGQKSELERRLAETQGGLTVGIAYDDAIAARSHITRLRAGSAVAATAGAIAVGAAVLWINGSKTDDNQLTVAPNSRGAIVTYGGTW